MWVVKGTWGQLGEGLGSFLLVFKSTFGLVPGCCLQRTLQFSEGDRPVRAQCKSESSAEDNRHG